MTCEQIRGQLTAYLDGGLEDERGGAVRGHLRACEACGRIAEDEAALRDGLRELPPVDPPPSLWAGVQARLAAAEAADAERPAWRAALARWFAPRTIVPRLPFAGAAVATVVLVMAWRGHRAREAAPVVTTPLPGPVASAPAVAPAMHQVAGLRDVSVELASQPAEQTRSYAEAADELMALAVEARAAWPDDRKQAFDGRVAELRAKIDGTEPGAPRQRAYRAMIRYLQSVAVRDEIAANDRNLAGGAR